MSSFQIIDQLTWKRKEHFAFFEQMDQPFFGSVVGVSCGALFNYCKEKKQSFFAHYLFRCIHAVNKIENFKYRIKDGKVVVFDKIHASSTILRSDETFGFSFLPFTTDFSIWTDRIASEKAAVEKISGLRHNDEAKRIDMIHFSALPWLHFTRMSHPSHPLYKGSVPKISVGAAKEHGDDFIMPVSIDVHHGLVDGLHVARFVDIFQELLDDLSYGSN